MDNQVDPAANQGNSQDQGQESPWEFLIAEEERHHNLNYKEADGEQSNASAQPKKSWLRRALSEPTGADWIIAAFTVVIAVVGIFQWIVIRGQLREMEKGGKDTHELAVQAKNQAIESGKANDLAKDALIKVQRAFVIIDTVPDMQPIEANGNQSILFNFYMENFGITPTRKTTAHINWATDQNALPDNFAFPDAWKAGVPHNNTQTVIGPKTKAPLNAGPIPKATIAKVFNHQMHLYFYGWVRYSDVFDNTPRHVTKFCYEMIPVEGKVHLQTGEVRASYQLATCGRFNCNDEECRE